MNAWVVMAAVFACLMFVPLIIGQPLLVFVPLVGMIVCFIAAKHRENTRVCPACRHYGANCESNGGSLYEPIDDRIMRAGVEEYAIRCTYEFLDSDCVEQLRKAQREGACDNFAKLKPGDKRKYVPVVDGKTIRSK